MPDGPSLGSWLALSFIGQKTMFQRRIFLCRRSDALLDILCLYLTKETRPRNRTCPPLLWIDRQNSVLCLQFSKNARPPWNQMGPDNMKAPRHRRPNDK